jgi:hypothetical protein
MLEKKKTKSFGRDPEVWFLLKVLVLGQHNLRSNFWCSKIKRTWIPCVFVSEDSCSLYAYSMSRHLIKTNRKHCVSKIARSKKRVVSLVYVDMTFIKRK